MKVVLYSDLGEGRGGAETVFRRVADGLEARGHEVVRVFADQSLPVGEYRRKGKKWYINISTPPSWKFFLKIRYVIRFFKSISGLIYLLKKVSPDVVNFHFYTEDALQFALLKEILGYRFVVSCHGSDVMDVKHMHKRSAPLVLSKADEITFVSNSLSKKLQKKVSKKLDPYIIHNGVDKSFFKRISSTKKKNSKKKLITVGSLRDVKGHDVLIQSFSHVVDRHPSATLKIVGGGPNRSSYESLVDEVGLADRITISGWCSQEEVRKALCEASVFVFPSRHEGSPLALVEAMAAGCPVVASEVGGIPEIVSGTPAMLVPPNDAVALAEAIGEALASREWQEKAAAASVRRASQYSWEKVIKDYEQCLRSG